ncbi:MAG: hypothetical protein V3T08_00660 [Gemmatimonadota bacterium]
MWMIGIVIVLVLMIPLTAIVLDSELGRALARRVGSGEAAGDEDKRLRLVEEEVRYLSEAVQSLQEEARFVRELLENRESEKALPPGED